MKISVDHDIFTDAVTWASRTIPNRPANAVLAGIYMKAHEDGTLSMGARDSDISSHITIEADVADAGEVLVNGKLLAEISRSLPHQTIELEKDGGKFEISCGNSHFTLKTMATEDYTELPAMPPVIGTVDGAEWEKAVSQVTIAASNDDTLPMLVSVCIEIEGDQISLMATDRYRLAIRDLGWAPVKSDISTRILVRASRLLDVAKALGSSGPIEISLQDQGMGALIGFSAGGRQNTMQLIDGEYPQVRSLFPTEVNGHVEMNRLEILDAIKRSRLVVEKNAAVRLSFSEGEVVLEAGQGDNAQVSEILQATLEGEDLKMAFNPVFLQEGFSVIDTPTVRLSFTHPTKPAVVTAQDKDGNVNDDFRLLLMPIRTFGAN
ncbi:DNA polymerase III subunit beta [Trueperella pecoris]|uniref:Beta sliding clamp n=1 Tax=Trueperella pecoris TaxID=2733571 RepID=A0A7M1QUR9_9ACTO|nr:DNA polymerase III subunit beta [Trueperella pecoris]QOQ39705.1 DNA polymerase III subunit beta [Trueperella pecoris]QOR45668.1 DNA polymerase III subunit beta [Trueperella pecoris]QTG75509.1 DNA polymerase III subunit beta [Trueperella pecoris]